MGKNESKGILKTLKAFIVATTVSTIAAITMFFAGSLPVGIKMDKQLQKFKSTNEYKDAIVAEVDDVMEEYKAGEIKEGEMIKKIEEIHSNYHAAKLLKNSSEKEMKAKYEAYSDVGEAVTYTTIGLCGSALALAVATCIAGKKAENAREEDDDEND